MSVLFALMLAASPATATAELVEKKPRLKCEWIHEVGTSRPRRICEKRVEKKKPAEQAGEQASDKQPTPDNSTHPQGTSE
jgi:hypothetical protein